MSKWWTGSSCELCRKLLRLVHQSEISDVPAGCIAISDKNNLLEGKRTVC